MGAAVCASLVGCEGTERRERKACSFGKHRGEQDQALAACLVQTLLK